MRIAAVAVLLAATPATANPPGWPFVNFEQRYEAPAATPRPRPRVVHVKRYTPTAVIVGPSRPARCLGPYESVGDQHLLESGAKDQAEKAWQQLLRFEKGELYADPANAIDKTFWCVKSSVGTGLFHRCRLRAVACAPEGN